MKRFIAAFAAFVSFAVVACVDSPTQQTSAGDFGGGTGGGCDATSDCGAPATCETVACVDHACITTPAADDTPCGTDKVCTDGLCGEPRVQTCVDSGDCAGRIGECIVNVCVNHACQTINDAFGVLCGKGAEICDGAGQCGTWMPQNAASCFEAEPVTPILPLCDDHDPATVDSYTIDPVTLEPVTCTNITLDEGAVCGPHYRMLNGACCPESMKPG